MKKIQPDQNTIDKIISLFNDRNNITQIVAKTNVGRRIVERILETNGSILKTKSELIADSIPALKDVDALRDLYEKEKFSIDEIALKLNTNSQVVKTAFKRLGISTRGTSDARATVTCKMCLKRRKV